MVSRMRHDIAPAPAPRHVSTDIFLSLLRVYVDSGRTSRCVYVHSGWLHGILCVCADEFVCMYVCMYDYIAVSTRTLTPPTTGTD